MQLVSCVRGDEDAEKSYYRLETYPVLRVAAEAAHPSTWGCKTSWRVLIATSRDHPLPQQDGGGSFSFDPSE